MRTISLLCLLACSSLASLQHAAAVGTYERSDLENKGVPDLVTIMRKVEIDEDEIDLVLAFSGDVKEAIIKLIVGDEKPKTASPQKAKELGGMKIGGLRKRALKAGVAEEEVENALDADDAKRALIDLIIAAEPQEKGDTNKASKAASTGWTRPKPMWRPPKADYARRSDPGESGSPQANLNLGVWFVNTTKHGPRGSEMIVQNALDQGADINGVPKDNNGMTPLMQGTTGGAAYEVLELLVNSGADMSVRDNHGYSLLDAAVGSARTDVVDMILGASSGIDLNGLGKDGFNAIHRVLGGRSPRYLVCLDSLMMAGASPKIPSQQGFEPIVMARYGETRISLIKKGACMPKWYIKMITEGAEGLTREMQNDGGHDWCEEEFLCKDVPEKSGKGAMAFKFFKDKTVREVGDEGGVGGFNAPGFITDQFLWQLCPCSTDMWVEPEICPEEVTDEQYEYLVDQFILWEAQDGTGGIPAPRAVPPQGLLEFQAAVQAANPDMYARHDTRPTESTQHQKDQEMKKSGMRSTSNTKNMKSTMGGM